MIDRPKVKVQNLALVDYKQAWDYQEKLLKTAVDIKIENRKSNQSVLPAQYILFCEHPHVYTLGKSGAAEHLLMTEENLSQIDAQYYKINRGGDITYHGPGQLVMYPILDLEQFFTDIHKYLRYLEETVIRTLNDIGIASERSKNETGVWIDSDLVFSRKICAMGVKASRWVTMHGLALNVNNDLSFFENIIPCGITNKSVTSISKEIGKNISLNDVKEIIIKHFIEIFSAKLKNRVN